MLAASCDYWRFGAGGRQENINAICILNLNIINDKVDSVDTMDFVDILFPVLSRWIKYSPAVLQVFLLLWWWFYLIAVLSLVRVIYRGVQCR